MAPKRNILLHTCCAVCLEAVLPPLAEEGFTVTVFFHNPNIHPYREFEKRLRAVEIAAEVHKLPLLADKEYGLQAYLDEILGAPEGRCAACYRVRLEAAAAAASRGGFGVFTTTLLSSPHQKHGLVAAAGAAAGSEQKVEFLYRDWRDRMPHGLEAARRRSLYRQHYCGCIWSEYEAFGPKPRPAGNGSAELPED